MEGLVAVGMMPVSDSDKLLNKTISSLVVVNFAEIRLKLTKYKSLASIFVSV